MRIQIAGPGRLTSSTALLASLSLAALGGCGSSNGSELTCGAGTRLVGNACLADTGPACGEGTALIDGECVATTLTPGNFQNPLIPLDVLHGVGSHTDEIRLRDDGLLLNCSYTFNVIDATSANRMRLLSPEEGLRHTVPGSSRAPGCKHLAVDGDLVFTTHLGTIRNPAFLSGWDISDPRDPVELPLMQEPGVSYEGVDVANGHIFVGLHENGLGVYTFDAAAGFTRVGGLGGFTNAWGIAARDNHVFVADGVGGFVTVDATDPTQPVELGRVVTGGQARFVVVDGDVAYVAAGSAGVAIVDISDLTEPRVIGRAQMPGTALRLDYSESRVFVAAWNDVRVYDVTTPSEPRFVAAVRIPRPFNYEDADRELPTMRTFGVAARGQDVFVGTWENPYSFRLEPDRLAPNIRLPEAAARVDFGPVAAGDSKTIPFEVTNQGTAPLTLVDTWVAGAAFSVLPRQARVQPGETIQLSVTYTASAESEEVGYLNIVSDDPAAPVRTAYLVGNPPGISVGAPLPLTTGAMLDGEEWTSAESAGEVLLLTFFATYCPVCANHLPDIEARLWQEYKDQGLQLVALNPRESTDQAGQVQTYVDNIKVTFPTGIEEPATTYGAVVANFQGPNPFPVDVIVDKNGIVRYATHEYDPDAMIEMIEQLLAE